MILLPEWPSRLKVMSMPSTRRKTSAYDAVARLVRALRRDPLDYDVAHTICEQMGLIAWSCNAKAVTVRIRIDFDHNLFDRSARCLAATDRSHSNKASRLHLCERAREVRLGPPSHLHQFDN